MRQFRVTGVSAAWRKSLVTRSPSAPGAGPVDDAGFAGMGGDAQRLASQGDYSVTFLDRYGNEIGTRGIRQS